MRYKKNPLRDSDLEKKNQNNYIIKHQTVQFSKKLTWEAKCGNPNYQGDYYN